jgi:Rrf2 family protein
MLKLTKKVEYALIALVHITDQEEGKLSSAKEIAEANLIPAEILAKTLQKLAALNLVKSVKGARGGYRICSDIDKINIIDFIEMLEGPVGLTDCSTAIKCDQECGCIIKDPMIQINSKIISTLKNITLDQFTKSVR